MQISGKIKGAHKNMQNIPKLNSVNFFKLKSILLYHQYHLGLYLPAITEQKPQQPSIKSFAPTNIFYITNFSGKNARHLSQAKSFSLQFSLRFVDKRNKWLDRMFI